MVFQGSKMCIFLLVLIGFDWQIVVQGASSVRCLPVIHAYDLFDSETFELKGVRLLSIHRCWQVLV